VGGKKTIVSEADDSIQIHSCHSAMREVEVLQDQLLARFRGGSDVVAQDVLIMTPDIRTYAPFIQAVFSLPPDDPRWIPFSIADLGIRQESPLIDAFLGFLDLAGSRFGATQVLAFSRERVRFGEGFPSRRRTWEVIHRWVRETGIRWGSMARTGKSWALP